MKARGFWRWLVVLFWGVIFLCGLAAAEPVLEWEKTFGGANEDRGYSVQQTTDGGYIIAGGTYSMGAGYADVYLIKTDPSGNLVWQKTFGGADDDYGYSVQQTTDEGYIIAGYTNSLGAGSYDVYLIKTDSSGNLIWQKTFGGTGWDVSYSVQQTTDGGYIIVGGTDSFAFYDVYLIKTDSAGNLIWEKTLGGPIFDEDLEVGHSVQQTSDGGYIIGGNKYSISLGGYEVYLIKTDSSGNLIWEKTFGSNSSANSVQQTTDGGYIVAGWYASGGRYIYYDVYLMKTDPFGNLLWSKTFGGSYDEFGNSVHELIEGGYIIVGSTNSKGAGDHDAYLIKTDTSGNLVWEKTFGRASGDWGESVQQTTDGGYIIAGLTESFGAGSRDVYLLKILEVPDLTLTPDSTSIPRGGTLGYTVTVTNNTGVSQRFQYWTHVLLPNGNKYPPMGELFGPYTLRLNPGETRNAHLTHAIPMTAPLGTYTYKGFIGPYPTVWDDDQFDFTVTTGP